MSARSSGRPYDRVGTSRLTGLGSIVLVGVILGMATPPAFADRQIIVMVWAAVLAVFVIGVAWPMISVRRIDVAARAPRDASVGERVAVEVELTGRFASCEVRALDPTSDWHRVTGPGVGSLDHLADRRGVFGVLRIEVRVTAPVGVLAARRVQQVQLPVPVEVAPRSLAVDWVAAPAPLATSANAAALAAHGGDLVRSVRPYAPGDPAHLVHWPSTARTGVLVVRELEPPAPIGQAIVIDLRDLGVDTERAASYALGAALAVLAAGGELMVCTAEVGGPVTGRVRVPIDARRRLARAVPGVPGEPPPRWPVVEIGR